jgi:hypothetical protein
MIEAETLDRPALTATTPHFSSKVLGEMKQAIYEVVEYGPRTYMLYDAAGEPVAMSHVVGDTGGALIYAETLYAQYQANKSQIAHYFVVPSAANKLSL